MVDLVEKAFQIISDDKDIILKYFDVCRKLPQTFESPKWRILFKCMEKAITILDSDDTEDDPFYFVETKKVRFLQFVL